jgi:hypothetical protein
MANSLEPVYGKPDELTADGCLLITIKPKTVLNGPGGPDWQCPHCSSVNIRGFNRPGDIAQKRTDKLLLQCHCGGLSDLLVP